MYHLISGGVGWQHAEHDDIAGSLYQVCSVGLLSRIQRHQKAVRATCRTPTAPLLLLSVQTLHTHTHTPLTQLATAPTDTEVSLCPAPQDTH